MSDREDIAQEYRDARADRLAQQRRERDGEPEPETEEEQSDEIARSQERFNREIEAFIGGKGI